MNHELLVKKLENYKLTPRYKTFFAQYLHNRSFEVKTGNFLSDLHPVHSGVSQGSNLNSHLFLLFFDDIKNVISNYHFEIYADDFKLSRAVEDSEDDLFLQQNIYSILNWFNININGIKCNVGKTDVVSFTRKHNTFFYDYIIAGSRIPRKFEHRDLGC